MSTTSSGFIKKSLCRLSHSSQQFYVPNSQGHYGLPVYVSHKIPEVRHQSKTTLPPLPEPKNQHSITIYKRKNFCITSSNPSEKYFVTRLYCTSSRWHLNLLSKPITAYSITSACRSTKLLTRITLRMITTPGSTWHKTVSTSRSSAPPQRH